MLELQDLRSRPGLLLMRRGWMGINKGRVRYHACSFRDCNFAPVLHKVGEDHGRCSRCHFPMRLNPTLLPVVEEGEQVDA